MWIKLRIASLTAAFLIVLVGTLPVDAQERIHIEAALLSWDGQYVPNELYGFRSAPQAERAVECVLSEAGGLRSSNFRVRASNVPNAAAVTYPQGCGSTTQPCERMLLYNPTFMRDIAQRTGNPWSGISIMAHEIGHHLEAHTIRPGGSNPPDELQADEFSGWVLRRLGASMEDAQAVFRTFPARGSRTHPGRDARLAAVAAGWDRANTETNPRCYMEYVGRDTTRRWPDDTTRRFPDDTTRRFPDIDFGNDSSEWAYDDECDDTRFTGDPFYLGVTNSNDHVRRDATDCRTLFQQRHIRLKNGLPRFGRLSPGPYDGRDTGTGTGYIDFGNDSSEWARDGECDDTRFTGDPFYLGVTDNNNHVRRDATDCRTLFQQGHIRLKDTGEPFRRVPDGWRRATPNEQEPSVRVPDGWRRATPNERRKR